MTQRELEAYLDRIRAAMAQMSAAIAETHQTSDRAKELADRSATLSLRIVSR